MAILGETIRFTHHAIIRARQRGVALSEAASAVSDFDRVLPGACWEPVGRELRTRKGVTAVYEPHRCVVLTVWREP